MDLCWQRSLKAFNQDSKVHPPCLQSLAAMALAGHTSQVLGVFLSIYKLQVCNVTPYTHLLLFELPENVPLQFHLARIAALDRPKLFTWKENGISIVVTWN